MPQPISNRPALLFLAANVTSFLGRNVRLLFVALLLPLLLSGVHAQTAHIGYTQVTLPGVFSQPEGVAVDAGGDIFIADLGNQAVIEIPSGCQVAGCVKTLLSGFGYPGGIAVDKTGNLFISDSLDSAVYELIAEGGYTELASVGSGFNSPYGLAVDGHGNVYVADSGNHAVKEVLVAGGYNTVNTLGSGFNVPGGIAIDGNGNVFVSDFANDVVKEMVAVDGSIPASPVIHTLGGGFSAPFGVAVGGSGNVFVADYNNSAVKEIPPGCFAAGCVKPLGGGFNYPSGVAVDGSGDVFIADSLNKRVVELEAPIVDFGSVAVGQTSAAISLFFTFDTGGTIGSPVALTQGAAALDFAIAGGSTCTAGSIWNAGATCTVNVTFTPKFPGLRTGAVLLKNISGSTITTVNVHGIGSGPQVSFLPGSQSTLGGGIGTPVSVALDASGNTYVADNANSAVKQIPPGCLLASCVNTIASNITAAGLAVDGGGNIFVVVGNSVQAIPSGCVTSACIKTVSNNFSFPNGIAVDGNGNLFVADASAVKEILAGDGYTGMRTLGGGFTGPVGIAVDGSGNVFVSDYDSNSVVEILALGDYSTARTLGLGFNQPMSVAVDASGNVFVADTGNNAVKEILAGDGYATVQTVARGFHSPAGIAVDATGNLFVADTYNNRVVKLDFADAPSLTFASTNTGASSAEQQVTLQNVGNQPLTLPIPAIGSNPAISQYFALDSSATTACPLVTTSSLAGSLASGTSCTLSISFDPTALGIGSGSLVLKDNTLNAAAPSYATQTIALQGAGFQSQSITFPNPGKLTYGAAPITLTASASSKLPVSYKVISGRNRAAAS